MKLFSSVLTGIVAAYCLASCTSKESADRQTNDSTVVWRQLEAQDYSGLPENFASFLSNFPDKQLPAKFPSDATYSEGDLKKIDEAFVKEFLNEDMFSYEPDDLYYLASLNIHPNLFSVLIFQVGDMGSPSYLLVNYNNAGKIVSSRILAYYETGGGMNSWSSAIVEKDGSVSIRDAEEGKTSDYKEENMFTYQISPAGAILPTGIPSELITTFHSATKKKGEYLIAPLYNSSTKEPFSNSFELRQAGDSIIFSPNLYFFRYDVPDDNDLIVDSYTKTSRGYQFKLKDIYNGNSQYSILSHLNLNTVDGKPGAYQLVFTASENDYEILMGVKSEYVIVQNKLSSYKTRKLPFIDADHNITTSGGLAGLWLSSNDGHIIEWGKEFGFTYKKEEEPGEGQPTVYHRFYDSNGKLAIEAIAHPLTGELQSMSVYSSIFKTDGGVGVGSTVGELLYGHESVSAVCGEQGVIVSISEYKHTSFIIDHIAGPPDSDLAMEKLDETLKISRVDFRLE